MFINPNGNVEFNLDKLKTIYLAGGCFWGSQAYMKRVLGVYQSICGYANGNTENPTYEEVCKQDTGHAETVKVVYDTSIISLEAVLAEFFSIIDPTTLNRQAHDIGTQYRTGIYFTDEADRAVAANFIKEKQKSYSEPIVTEVLELQKFYDAEEYHQDYLDKNPGGYCHVDLSKYKAD